MYVIIIFVSRFARKAEGNGSEFLEKFEKIVFFHCSRCILYKGLDLKHAHSSHILQILLFRELFYFKANNVQLYEQNRNETEV